MILITKEAVRDETKSMAHFTTTISTRKALTTNK